tara:strand:- start:916 stop:1401 length:486 start_codon:yes stop_codon:yes gene_type:complete
MFGNLFNNKSNLNLLIFSIFILIIDQVTKVIIVSKFNLYESISIFPFLNITFIVNYGFAFGFLNSPSLNQIIVSIVILSIIIYFLYLLIRTQDHFFKFCLVLILSGAVGNFLDRILRGYVVDFIDIYVFNYHWPAFNIADSCISIGFVILIFNILFLNKKI